MRGKMVRVRGEWYEPELRGVVGSVLWCYGEPEYLALEVIPKDSRTLLFWHYEVEEIEAWEKST